MNRWLPEAVKPTFALARLDETDVSVYRPCRGEHRYDTNLHHDGACYASFTSGPDIQPPFPRTAAENSGCAASMALRVEFGRVRHLGQRVFHDVAAIRPLEVVHGWATRVKRGDEHLDPVQPARGDRRDLRGGRDFL